MDSAASVAAVSVTALLTSYVLWRALNPIPSTTLPMPKGYPIIGNAFQMAPYMRKFQGHILNDELTRRLGHIYAVRVVNEILVWVSDPAAAKLVTTSDEIVKSDKVQKLLEDGLKYPLFFLPTDATWRRHRKYLQPGFGPNHLRRALTVTNDTMTLLCKMLVERRQELGATYQPDLYHLATCVTIDVIGLVAFSHKYGCVASHEDPSRLGQLEAFKRFVEILPKRLASPIRATWRLRGIDHASNLHLVNAVRSAIEEAMNNKRASMEDGLQKKDSALEMDVMDRLLSVDWSDQEITDEIIALFLAGSETSANTIAFVLQQLDLFPEIRRRVEEEVDQVLPSAEPYDVTQEMLGKLTYLDWVIKETLRLYPAVNVMAPRTSSKPIEIGGHMVPPKSLFLVDVRNLHRNASAWERPLDFWPERWENFTPVPGSYMPFGEGIHQCLGMKMALMEMKCVLARFCKQFRFTVVPGQDLTPQSSVTFGLKGGMHMTVEIR